MCCVMFQYVLCQQLGLSVCCVMSQDVRRFYTDEMRAWLRDPEDIGGLVEAATSSYSHLKMKEMIARIVKCTLSLDLKIHETNFVSRYMARFDTAEQPRGGSSWEDLAESRAVPARAERPPAKKV